MRKRLTIATLALFATLVAVAQPVINSSIFPSVGTIFYSYNTSLPSGPGQSGANRTWNFSTLTVYQSAVDSSTVFAVSATQVRDSFLAGQIAIGDYTDTTYQIFNNSAQRCETLGSSDESEVTRFDSPLTYFSYPFSYTNSLTDNTSITVNLFGLPVVTDINVTTTYDGHGSIVLPDGRTLNNVARIKTVQASSLDFGGVTSTTETEVYSWFLPNQFQPVFSLTYNTVDAFGMVMSDTSAVLTRTTPISAINEPGVVEAVKLFPNPVQNTSAQLEVELKENLTNAKLMVVDMLGRVIFEQLIPEVPNGANTFSLPTDKFPAGYYRVGLHDGKQLLFSEALIKQ